MEWARSSGVLLHVTSLPGRFGIGDLGPEARRFADWLAEGGQKIWQMLPLNPTGYGDSPYQALSAFAGNPLLISVEDLVRDGLLDAAELADAPEFPQGRVDFEAVKRFKLPLLRKGSERFHQGHGFRPEYELFAEANAAWLDDFSLFNALKHKHGERAWTEWEPKLRSREARALAEASTRLKSEIAAEKFAQWIFARQWKALRDHCRARGMKLMGDLPIYVAHDSSDVWVLQSERMFHLLPDGRPEVVAGVPPDYFSATGQLWGNPIYDWKRHEQTGFAWWIERFRHTLAQFDYIRVDHFRGFEAYWEIPGGDKTAERGRWTKAPGLKLFAAVEAALGKLPILAENLGVITTEVEGLRTRFDLPGMTILQFAFGADAQAPYFKPHNYTHDRVAYTGTHDNDTVMGWWQRREATATETAEQIAAQHEFAARYLRFGDEAVNWAFIRALMASVAEAVLYPMQDVLGLGTESRMNYPGTSSGNWGWRMRNGELRKEDAARLRELAKLYDR